ncbi:MAG TPA: protein-glutamate O-methyltransferase CheR [Desulfuromonadaceae bacterium]
MNPTSHSDDATSPLLAEITDAELEEIGMILGSRRHFDLSVYKPKCMKRRVAIRMRATDCGDVTAYCGLLQLSDREVDLLQKTLTIHVSQFFRNPSMFEKLQTDVIPPLFAARGRAAGAAVRFWCLGCAGGEEPYSLAILLREHFSRELGHTRAVITGTDIDPDTLRSARQAEYDEDRLKDVPSAIRERYFRHQGTHFALIPAIRDMVTFLQGDMCDVAEYQASDLVLCRNTLIYFARPVQETILHGIADCLPTGGVLVLGKSESLVGTVRQRFAPVCRTERIYRKV